MVDPIFVKSRDVQNPENEFQHKRWNSRKLERGPEQFEFTMGPAKDRASVPQIQNFGQALNGVNEESRIKQAESEQERQQAEAEALVYIEMLETRIDERNQVEHAPSEKTQPQNLAATSEAKNSSEFENDILANDYINQMFDFQPKADNKTSAAPARYPEMSQKSEEAKQTKIVAPHSTPTFKDNEKTSAEAKPEEPANLQSKGRSLLRRMQVAIKSNLAAIKLKLANADDQEEEVDGENRENGGAGLAAKQEQHQDRLISAPAASSDNKPPPGIEISGATKSKQDSARSKTSSEFNFLPDQRQTACFRLYKSEDNDETDTKRANEETPKSFEMTIRNEHNVADDIDHLLD